MFRGKVFHHLKILRTECMRGRWFLVCELLFIAAIAKSLQLIKINNKLFSGRSTQLKK